MLLPLLDLAPELQSLFVLLLVDTATAGRLAQASSACKELLQHRLDELREERRGVEQARMEETKQRKRTAILWCFEEVDGGAFYECKLLCTAGGTPWVPASCIKPRPHQCAQSQGAPGVQARCVICDDEAADAAVKG